jgi:O-antigen/teichoic acid export membrane protein
MIKSIAHSIISFTANRFRIDALYFFKGGFWLLFTQAITILGSLIVAVIFTKELNTSEYGIYRYLIALAVLFSTFSLTGIGQSISQAAAKGHTEFFPYGMKVSLLYNIGVTSAGILGFVYYYINGNNILALGCIVIAILQPVINTCQNTVPFLQGLKLFKESARLQVLRVVLITSISIIVIYFTHNVFYLLIGFLFSQVIGNSLSVLLFRNKVDTQTKLTDEIRLKYLQYAQHTSIQNIIIGVATRLDSIIVFQFLGATNLALYSIAILIPDQIKGTCKNLIPLLVPKYAQHQTLKQTQKHIPKRSIQFFIALTVSSILLIFLIPSIYRLLFPSYTSAIIYSQILLTALPTAVYLIPLTGLQTQLRNNELYTMNIYSALIHIIVSFSLIYNFGLMGAIIARVSTQYLHMMLTFYVLLRAK